MLSIVEDQTFGIKEYLCLIVNEKCVASGSEWVAFDVLLTEQLETGSKSERWVRSHEGVVLLFHQRKPNKEG